MNNKETASAVIVLGMVTVMHAMNVLAQNDIRSKQSASNDPQAAQSVAGLPDTCIDHEEAVPVIISITPSFGPVGTKVEIRGCNFQGFEGGFNALFVRSDGAEIPLRGIALKGRLGKSMRVIVQSYCESGHVFGEFSGASESCKTAVATPGIYRVYVTAWGKKSNAAIFTVKK